MTNEPAGHDRARPGGQDTRWRDLAPALVLLCVGLAGIAVATLLTTAVPGQYLIVAPFGTAQGQVLDMVFRAGGAVIGFGGIPNIVIAASSDAGFTDAMRAEGAWLAMPSPRVPGCFVDIAEGRR